MYLFLAVLGLHCCVRAFSTCFSLVTVQEQLPVMTSHSRAQALGCGLQEVGHTGSVAAAPRLQGTASGFVAHELRCLAACGIFPDRD